MMRIATVLTLSWAAPPVLPASLLQRSAAERTAEASLVRRALYDASRDDLAAAAKAVLGEPGPAPDRLLVPLTRKLPRWALLQLASGDTGKHDHESTTTSNDESTTTKTQSSGPRSLAPITNVYTEVASGSTDVWAGVATSHKRWYQSVCGSATCSCSNDECEIAKQLGRMESFVGAWAADFKSLYDTQSNKVGEMVQEPIATVDQIGTKSEAGGGTGSIGTVNTELASYFNQISGENPPGQQEKEIKQIALDADAIVSGPDGLEKKEGEAEDLLNKTTTDTEGLLDTMETQSSQTSEKFMDDLEENTDLLKDQVEKEQEKIEENSEEAAEEIEVNDDAVIEATRNEKDTGKEYEEGLKEVKTTANQLRKGVTSTNKFVESAVNKALETAANFPNQLTADKMSAESFIGRGLSKVEQAVKKETKSVQKAVMSEFKTAQKEAVSKEKEWKKAHDEYVGDMTTGVRDALVANLDRQDKVLTQQGKLDDQMEGALAAAKKAEEDADRAQSSSQELISTEADKVMDKVKDAADVFEMQKARADGIFTGDMRKMEREVVQTASQEADSAASRNTEAVNQQRQDYAARKEELLTSADMMEDALRQMQTLMTKNQRRMNELMEVLPSIVEASKLANKESAEKIGVTRDETVDAVAEELKFMTEKGAEFDTMAKETTDTSRKEAVQWVASMKEYVLDEIEQMRRDTANQLKKTDSVISMNANKGATLLAGMEKTVSDVVAEKDGMKETLDATEKALDNTIGENDVETMRLRKVLDENWAELLKSVEMDHKQTTDAAASQLEEMRDRLHRGMDDAVRKNDMVISNIHKGLQGFVESTERDAAQAHQQRDEMAQKAQALTEEQTGFADESAKWAEDLKNKIRETSRALRDAEKGQLRKLNDLVSSLTSDWQDGIRKEQGKMKDSWKVTYAEVDDKLKKQAAQAAATIKRMEGELQESTTTTGAELQKTSAQAQSVNFLISKEEAEAQQKSEDELRKMDLLRTQALHLEGKSAEEVENFKQRIEQGDQGLRSKMFGYVTQFNQRGDKAQASLKAEAGGIAKDLATRQALDTEKLGALLGNFDNKMGPLIQEMDDSAKATKGTLGRLESQGREFAESNTKEQGDLQRAIDLGKQQVNQAVNSEEEANAGKVSQGVSGLEGLLGSLSGAQTGTKEQLGSLQTALTQELAMHVAAGGEFSEEMAQKIKDLQENAPDLAAEFAQATQGRNQQLSEGASRFTLAQSQAQDQLQKLHVQLQQARDTRSKEAARLHNVASDFKKESVESLDGQVAQLMDVKRKEQEAVQELRLKQKKLDRSIVTIGGFESTADESKQNEVAERTFKLEQSSQKNYDWQFQFKHRTMAWRDEVERRLEQLEASIAEDAASVDSMRVDEDQRLNKGMRNAGKRAEREVTDAAAQQAAKVDNVMGAFSKQLNGVMGEQDNAGAEDEEQLRQAEQIARNNQKGEEETMSEVRDSENRVSEKSAELSEEVEGKGAKLEDQLSLAKLGLNPGLDEQVRKLTSKISKVNSRGSLLETEKKEQTQEEKDADEKAALMELREELLKSNEKLTHQDELLEKEAAKIEAAVAAHLRKHGGKHQEQ